jgi:hypothetical protein
MEDTLPKPPPASRISQETIEEVLARARKRIARSQECIRQTKALQKSSRAMIAESWRKRA